MTRVLVVQTAYLGDVVLTTPLLREVKRALPDAELTVLSTPTGACILQGAPGIDELLVYDKRAGLYALRGLAKTSWGLRRRRFDVAIAAQRSIRTGILVRGGGARRRIGFRGAAGGWAYDVHVPWDRERHAVDRYLALSEPLGGDPAAADRTPELRVSEALRARAGRELDRLGVDRNEPIVAIAPGSVWATKRWLPEGFAAVADWVRSRGLRAVLLGSPAERALCERVRSSAHDDTIVGAGSLSLEVLTAVLERAVALVCNDSGPAHVAAAVGTPVVSVFGPTVPAMGYAPFGPSVRIVEHDSLACRPCDHHGPTTCPEGHFRCMREIGAGRVVAELADLLRQRPSVAVAES